MAVGLGSGYETILSVLAVTVVVAAVAIARPGGRVGGRGALLDAAVLASGTAVTCWAVSVALWPAQAVDVASLVRTAVAASALGLVMPAVLAARTRAGHLVPIAVTAHTAAQASALASDPLSAWTVYCAAASLAVGAAAAVHGGLGRRPRTSRTAASRAHVMLLALSWIAAPTLLVVLQAADVTVSPRPLILGWVVMVILSAVRLVDLSARCAVERADRDAAQRFRGAFEQAHPAMALVVTDGPGSGTLSDVNEAMCRLLGTARADLIGRPVGTLVRARADGGGYGPGRAAPERRHGDRPLEDVLERLPQSHRIQLPSELALATTGRDAWGVASLSTTDGAGRDRAVLQIEDVTERRAARDHLHHLALQDPLTGLANRGHLQERIGSALARAERAATPVAVVVIDLDRFAAVNQRYGSDAADEVLVEAGSRLRAVTRPGDTVARLGADHFAVLLGDLTGVSDAMAVADRICTVLARPYHLREAHVLAAAAVGVAVAGSGSAPHEVLTEARLAVDLAKRTGSRRPVRYDDELRSAARDRAALAADLCSALTGTGLRLVYQPLVSLPAGGGSNRPVTGWEAQLRWDRRTVAGTDRELLPGDFLGVAADAGLLVPIGNRSLEIALAALRVLPPPADCPAPTMAVNLPHRQLVRGDAAARVLRAAETARVDTRQLCIEIDETSLQAGGDELVATLRRLRRESVTVALDDFGTGHTSLSHLGRLPIDILKIDTSLVTGLDRGTVDAHVVSGLVQLAAGRGLRVVAQGVETAMADRAVQQLGVSEAQGPFYGLASPAPWRYGEPPFAPLVSPRRPAQATPGLVVS